MPLISYPRPEAGRWLVRRAFRRWPGRRGRWLDLSSGTLRQDSPGIDLPRVEDVRPGPELLYIPPVEPSQEEPRAELIRALGERGVALLVQCSPGDAAVLDVEGASVVFDLLDDLVRRSLEGFSSLPAGCTVAWPLVAGISDDPELWEEACARLAGAGVRCIQAVTPELKARDRQQLVAESGGADELFDSLFHRRPASERELAVVAARHGLASFFRPPSRAGSRHERNLELAEILALAGEIWLRLGRSEVCGQDFFRASHWAASTSIEVRAVALEGNLGVVGWARAEVSELILEWASTGCSKRLEEWLGEYGAETGASGA